jgi:hypothetical protein
MPQIAKFVQISAIRGGSASGEWGARIFALDSEGRVWSLDGVLNRWLLLTDNRDPVTVPL